MQENTEMQVPKYRGIFVFSLFFLQIGIGISVLFSVDFYRYRKIFFHLGTKIYRYRLPIPKFVGIAQLCLFELKNVVFMANHYLPYNQ